MKIGKVSVAFSIIILAALVLVGCGSGDGPGQGDTGDRDNGQQANNGTFTTTAVWEGSVSLHRVELRESGSATKGSTQTETDEFDVTITLGDRTRIGEITDWLGDSDDAADWELYEYYRFEWSENQKKTMDGYGSGLAYAQVKLEIDQGKGLYRIFVWSELEVDWNLKVEHVGLNPYVSTESGRDIYDIGRETKWMPLPESGLTLTGKDEQVYIVTEGHKITDTCIIEWEFRPGR